MMRRRRFIETAALASFAMVNRSAIAKSRARVVVVGGGFAGSSCALAVRTLDPQIDVTLIDPDEKYVTCPMSNEVIVGKRDIASLTIDRSGLSRAGVRVVRDRVVGIESQKRRVSLAGGGSVEYDRLVVAPGIRFLSGSLEGYVDSIAEEMPHAWRAGAQTLLLAKQLRAMEDGGVVAIIVPGGLMRCPPAPYERASLIGEFFKREKPRSKVLIFDANNHFPRQDEFTDAWRTLYPGIIEWISPLDGGTIERIDAKKRTLYTARGAQRVAVANIIPPQAPGAIAVDAGLSIGHGWCPVDAATFESKNLRGVHVLGDACAAGAMPKSASAAHSQAIVCAAAIVQLLGGKTAPNAEFDSVCYSRLGAGRALSIHGKFRVVDNEIRSVAESSESNVSPQDEVARADAWYSQIVKASFGG